MALDHRERILSFTARNFLKSSKVITLDQEVCPSPPPRAKVTDAIPTGRVNLGKLVLDYVKFDLTSRTFSALTQRTWEVVVHHRESTSVLRSHTSSNRLRADTTASYRQCGIVILSFTGRADVHRTDSITMVRLFPICGHPRRSTDAAVRSPVYSQCNRISKRFSLIPLCLA